MKKASFSFGKLTLLYLYPKLAPNNASNEVSFSGGVQQIMFYLAQYFQQNGANIIIASDDLDSSCIVKKLKGNGINHISVPFRSKNPLGLIKAVNKLFHIIKYYDVDLINSHHRWTTVFSFFVSKMFKIPTIYTAHNVFHDRRIFRRFTGEHIIAVSNGVRDNLISYFNTDSDRIKVIHNGTDISKSSAGEKKRVKEDLCLKQDDRIIAVIGRLSEQKGHKYLIKALPVVIKKFPNIKVLFVGDGELRNGLQNQVVRMNIKGNVLFCGSRNNVASFIEISEFTVLPSLWEGFSVAIIESLLLGKPVIASNVGGTPEIIENNLNGLLVETKDVGGLANAIIYMLSHPGEVKKMGEKGREKAVKKFSLKRMLEEYKKYYIHLLGRRK